MIKRVIPAMLVVAVLVVLIFYSQIRVADPFVSGIIETDEIRLGSRLGGRVKAVFVEEGDRVTQGMALIEFEPYDLLERERQALAELAAREASLRQLKSGLRPEEIAQAQARLDQLTARLRALEAGPRPEEIEAARARLDAANAEQVLAKSEYDRRDRLMQTNAVSRSDLDAAREKLEAAIANVEVRNNELAILQAGTRPEEIDQARAQVEESRLAWELASQGYRVEEIEKAEAARDASEAALAAIGQQKTELIIVAPENGFVDALDLQPGDLVGANAPVLTILSDQRLWVRAYVPQRFLKLAVGQSLRVTVDAWPDEEFRGVVSFLSRQAEFVPSNVQTVDERARQVYRIRVMLEAGGDKLRSGMTADVWLASPVDGGS